MIPCLLTFSRLWLAPTSWFENGRSRVTHLAGRIPALLMTKREPGGCAILSSETRRRYNPWIVSSRFPPFSQCSSLVDKSAWLASCLDMTCDCLQKGGESRECKCSALEDYVRQCRRHQPTIHLQDWRSMHLCREYFRFLSTRRYLLSQRRSARRVLCTTIASITAANRLAPPSGLANPPAHRCR